jgi:lysozyme family protein
MSSKSFPQSLQLVLAHEGGYVNHPADPGGATNKGVTQKVYDTYRRSLKEAPRSVKSITKDEVADIYRNQYWGKVDGDALPAGLDYAVFDYAVNSGVSKAVKDLQRTLRGLSNKLGEVANVRVDGVMGQSTIAAAEAAANDDEVGIITSLCDRRMTFLKSLKTYGTFGKGWKRRVMGAVEGYQETDKGVIDYAIKMALGDLAHPIPKSQLPAAIGTRKDESPEAPKPVVKDQSILKTAQGIGATLAGAGVTGQVALEVADTAKTKIDATLFGQAALILFILAMIAGVGLLVFKYFEDRREKSAE